jgi:uncharacterized integral membrane protein
MKVLTWIILITLALLAVFTVANWSLFTAPATLDFVAFSLQGPLGLILLGVMFVVVALFTIYALSLRTTALVEQRRHTKALEVQRELADRAEASRFTALGSQLEQECARLRTLVEASRAETLARCAALEQSLLRSMDETSNAVFANIGQLDDKLDRVTRGNRNIT